MRCSFFTCFMVGLTANLSVAQDWSGEVRWIYEQIEIGAAPGTSVQHINVGDTIIQDRACVKLEREWFDLQGRGLGAPKWFYLSVQERIIDYYELKSESFFPLYNFNLNVGDTLTTSCLDGVEVLELSQARVDSISTIQRGEVILKVQHLTMLDWENSRCHIEGIAIERVGFPSYFFAQSNVMDPPVGGRLLCYQDNSLIYPDDAPCTLKVGVNDVIQKDVQVFPNPTSGLIYFNGETPDLVEIFNITGELMISQPVEQSLSLVDIVKGVYILRLQYDEGYVLRRIIKQ